MPIIHHFWKLIFTLFLTFVLIAGKKSESTLSIQQSSSSLTGVKVEDSLALVALYNATNGESWDSSENWLEGNVSTWHGITVENERVVRVDLRNNNLLGIIPSEIGDLDRLEFLSFMNNALLSIPSEIGQLKNLTEFSVQYNDIVSLPSEIGEATNLKEFYAGYNLLSDLPNSLENLINLERLGLAGNQISEIPDAISKLTNLKDFFANYNLLSGLPDSFEELTNLGRLELSGNEFSEIPDVIWTLTSLTKLTMSENQISFIPSEIESLSNLTDLELVHNDISSLPNEIWSLKTLSSLYISYNQLSSLPSDIEQLSNLTNLFVQNNYITTLPEEIWTLTSLFRLDLSHNQLTILPEEIDNLVSLEILSLASNKLEQIPTAIKEGNNINTLYLENNRFDFSDLETLVQKDYNCAPWVSICLIYSPQAKIGISKTDTLKLGTPFEAVVSAGGTSTHYQWFKDGEILEEETDSTLTIEEPTFLDTGVYTCQATNDFADELTLVSEPQYLVLLAEEFSIDQNGGGDYSSIQAAIDDLKNGNILLEEDESVIFNIAPNSGIYDEQIIIPQIEATSPTFTVNINGNGNVLTSTSTDCSQPAIIQLDGADFVVISNLNIEAEENAEATWGIHLKNEANTVQIVNCMLDVNSVATDTCFAGIVASNSNVSFLDKDLAQGMNANSTTIQSCNFVGGYAAIAIIGDSDLAMIGPNILNNTVTDAFQNGILVKFSNGAVVNNNIIDMTNFDTNGEVLPSGNESTSIAYKCVVGQLEDYFKKQIDPKQGFPVHIQNNQLKGIEFRGIDLNDCHRVRNPEEGWPQPPLALIVNNTLEGDFASSDTVAAGIYVKDSKRLNFYHNSIEIKGTGLAVLETAFFVKSSQLIGVLNNSLAYTGISDKGYSIYIEDSSSIAWDYNNYYSENSPRLAHFNDTDYNDLNAIPGNSKSISTEPTFIFSFNDGSELLDTASIGVANLINYDFEGDLRPDPITFKPDIGANEFVIGIFDSTFNQTTAANVIDYDSPSQWKHIFKNDSIAVSVNSTVSLGEINTDLYIHNQENVRVFDEQFYLDRNFRLEAENGFSTTETVQIRLYITQRELDKLMEVDEQINSFKDLNLTYLYKESGGDLSDFSVDGGETKFFVQQNSQQISDDAYLLEYRLTGIGQLGQFWLHGGNAALVVSIEGKSALTFEGLSIYPNPSDERFSVEFDSPNNNKLTMIKVWDLKGNLIHQYQFNAVLGKNRHELEALEDLVSGVYLVEVRQGKQKEVRKVLKR